MRTGTGSPTSQPNISVFRRPRRSINHPAARFEIATISRDENLIKFDTSKGIKKPDWFLALKRGNSFKYFFFEVTKAKPGTEDNGNI